MPMDKYETLLRTICISGGRSRTNFAIGSTGHNNVFMGFHAGMNNIAGSFNTAIGSQALLFNSTGIENTAVDNEALLNNTGSFNTAIGI